MPATQSMLGWVMGGSLSALRHWLAERVSATERRDRVKPHNSEYVCFHLVDRSEASRLVAATASTPSMPSTENTSGVKWRW